MVTCVGPSAYHSQRVHPPVSRGGDVAALEGRIQQARAQLNDWSSCVSAKTPKGQAEIQKFSGEISADEQKVARLQQSQANSAAAATADDHTPALSGGTDRRGILVDLWA